MFLLLLNGSRGGSSDYQAGLWRARTRGARNADHAERPAALIGRLRARLTNRATIGQASLRELAASAGVSVPTLPHDFGTRDDIVAAVMTDSRKAGQVHLEVAVAADPWPGESSRKRMLSLVRKCAVSFHRHHLIRR